MHEIEALREHIRLHAEVLESLAQRFAGILFFLEAAESAMIDSGEKGLAYFVRAREAAREGIREAGSSD